MTDNRYCYTCRADVTPVEDDGEKYCPKCEGADLAEPDEDDDDKAFGHFCRDDDGERADAIYRANNPL